MRSRSYITMALAALTLGTGFLVLTAARARNKRVEVVDFGKRIRATNPTFDARLAPASDAAVKDFRIPIKDATIEIAKGVYLSRLDVRRHGAGPGDSRPRRRRGSHHRRERIADAALDRFSRGTHSGERRLPDDHAEGFHHRSSSSRATPARSWCTAARRP